MLFGDLEANRRLAGNDIRVVEGMDQHSAGPLAVGSGSHERIINGVTGEFDLGPVRQRCFDLWQRRPRHEHRGAHAEQRRGECHALHGCRHWPRPLRAPAPAGLSWAIRLYAPRILKEPVRCRFSHLR